MTISPATRQAGRPWPTHEQTLLLRAALGTGDEAAQAYAAWRTMVDIDTIDGGSFRLLPLLYTNLNQQGLAQDDHELGRLKGLYRYSWYRNRVTFAQLAKALTLLHAAGIETMVLKGVALSLLYYRDAGGRSMADCDLLVRPEQALAAFGLLERAGWLPDYQITPRTIATFYEVGFTGANQVALDFHWFPFWGNQAPGDERAFWDHAVPLTIEGVTTLAPGPTELLLHICIHAARWNTTPPFRWIADATTLLRSANAEIAWDRLIAEATRLQVVLPLAATLDHLARRWAAPVPPEVLLTLRTMPVSPMLRLEHAAKLGPLGFWRKAIIQWSHAHRAARGGGPIAPLRHLPLQLQELWQLESSWQVPNRAARAGVRRLTGRNRSIL